MSGGVHRRTRRHAGGLAVALAVLAADAGLVVAAAGRQALAPPSTDVSDTGELEGELDDPSGAAAWFASSRGVEDTGVPVEAYLAGQAHIELMLDDQLAPPGSTPEQVRAFQSVGAAAGTWRWLGPSNRGGRTRALAIDPLDPQVMFTAGITGGIWRSADGGANWSPLTDTLSNIAVGVLEITPSNPDVVYAGTGEGYYAPYRWYRGGGIMRSTDHGLSWAFLESTEGNPNFHYVSDVEVSHNDPDRVYAATVTGVWRSEDAGLSWGTGPVLAATTPAGCLELAIRTDRVPDVVFASCGGVMGSQGVYRSVDGGNTWEPVITDVGGELVGVTSLAVARSDQEVVYASVAGLDERALGLLRSAEGGAPGTWTLQNGGVPDWFTNCRYPDYAQGGYDNTIAVDPTAPDRVWIGGVDLFRSDDAGVTMSIASDWNLRSQNEATPYVHADQHEIVFHPRYNGTTNRTVYFAGDGGLFRTDDDRADLSGSACGGVRGMAYAPLNNGYGVAQFVGGAVSDDGRTLLGGTQDNGTILAAAGDGPAGWTEVVGGDGGNSAIDSGRGTLFASQFGFSFYRRVGGRWGLANRGIQYPEDGALHSLFYPPIEMSRDDARVLWTGGEHVWRTTDSGGRWRRVSQSFGSVVSAIGLASGDGNLVYVGLEDGTVLRSTNALVPSPSWTDVSGPLPSAKVGALAVDPRDHDVAYASFGEFGVPHVWKTTDGGRSWQNVDGDLPDFPVNTVAINPTNSAMVYAGTDMGVFESLDGGLSWRVANENLATTIISRLVFRGATSDLYAFTFGRGAYRVDVGSAAPPVNDDIDTATPVTMGPSFSDRVDTRVATTARDDPEVSCGPTLDPRQAKSVWFRLEVVTAGTFEISTRGSNYDTVVAVFTRGASPGSLVEAACDDDGVEVGGASRLTVRGRRGGVYLIEVTRSSDASGDGLGNILAFRVSPGSG